MNTLSSHLAKLKINFFLITIMLSTDLEILERETTPQAEAPEMEDDLSEMFAKYGRKAERYEQLFAMLYVMKEHIEKYGVDKTFLRMYNDDDSLSKLLKIELPSCESLHERDASLDRICMESIGETIGQHWQSLKDEELYAYTAIRRLVQNITDDFSSRDKQMKDLLTKLQKVKNVPEDLEFEFHDSLKNIQKLFELNSSRKADSFVALDAVHKVNGFNSDTKKEAVLPLRKEMLARCDAVDDRIDYSKYKTTENLRKIGPAKLCQLLQAYLKAEDARSGLNEKLSGEMARYEVTWFRLQSIKNASVPWLCMTIVRKSVSIVNMEHRWFACVSKDLERAVKKVISAAEKN